MPPAADVLLLVGFLSHLGDLGMAVDGGEEPVDVDRAESARDCEVLLGSEVLIADDDDAVLEECSPDSGERLVVDPRREVDAEDFDSQRSRDRPDLHPHVSHRHVSDCVAGSSAKPAASPRRIDDCALPHGE